MATTATCLTRDSLDDLLRAAIKALLKSGEPVSPTKGPNRELRGVTLQLTNPRARLSRSESRGKVFSALGELLWYLSGSGETAHITHYISQYQEYDEDGIVFGAYGPRLRGNGSTDRPDQLAGVIDLLGTRPATRRAVIQLFEGTDLVQRHEDVPCTCTLQFFRRGEHLDLVVHMRSNDVFIGFPHDVFCFTMIQELVARSLGIELGQYIHLVGSLHLYDDKIEAAKGFLAEGLFATTAMPAMPAGDPMPAVAGLIALEEELRLGGNPSGSVLPSDPYWADLASLLIIFNLERVGRHGEVASIGNRMSTDVYKLHIDDRLDRGAQAQ